MCANGERCKFEHSVSAAAAAADGDMIEAMVRDQLLDSGPMDFELVPTLSSRRSMPGRCSRMTKMLRMSQRGW